MPDSESELDIYDAPNVFICTVSNPDLEEPMTATAVNDNPMSALSTVRRRRRIPTVVQLDNIASQEELQRYAEHLAFESMLTSKTVTVTTLAEPGHGVGDVVAVSRDGAERDLSGDRLVPDSLRRTDDVAHSQTGGVDMSSEDLSYSFATIDQIYDDGITLIFDGEETASEKHYKCNSFCIFAPEQRVRIIKDSGTYVVEYPVGNPNADAILPAGGTDGQV